MGGDAAQVTSSAPGGGSLRVVRRPWAYEGTNGGYWHEFRRLSASRDGLRLAFDTADTPSPRSQHSIWVMNNVGLGLRRLVAGAWRPVISPDGRFVAYRVDGPASERKPIHVVAFDGKYDCAIAGTGALAYTGDMAWSDDGRHLYYGVRDYDYTAYDVMKVDVRSGAAPVRAAANATGLWPRPRSVGSVLRRETRLADGTHYSLFGLSADGQQRILLRDSNPPAWSPSGTHFLTGDSGCNAWRIYRADVSARSAPLTMVPCLDDVNWTMGTP